MNAAGLSLFCGSVLLGTAPGLRAGHPPDITRHPVPQVAMAGSSITLIGATSDVLATSFFWEKDGLPVPGATSPTLVLRHLQPADAGDYQLIVSNHRAVAGAPPVGEAASRRARLDVITPVVAAGQLDQAFADATGPGFSARAVLALPDGGCLIAGEAATGRPLLRLVRLTAASPGRSPWLQTTATPLPVSIPTFDRVALSFPVPALVVDDLRVRFDLQHSDVNDLMIDLIAPDGQRVSLLDLGRVRRGSGFGHTVFADDAPFVISEGAAPFRGSWRPAGAAGFSILRRPHAAGVWRIIVDDTGADSSAGTVLRAALEFHSPAVLPAFTAALPAGTPGFQRPGSTGWLRHWNAPPGRTVLSEFSSNLILWQPAAVLGIRMEEDQSQLRRLALPALAAGYFRSAVR